VSNLDLVSDKPSSPSNDTHKAKAKSKSSKFRILIVLVGVIVALGLLAPRAISMFSSAPDFPGPGSGSVQLQIEPGASLAKIGNDLKTLGVVASL